MLRHSNLKLMNDNLPTCAIVGVGTDDVPGVAGAVVLGGTKRLAHVLAATVVDLARHVWKENKSRSEKTKISTAKKGRQ